MDLFHVVDMFAFARRPSCLAQVSYSLWMCFQEGPIEALGMENLFSVLLNVPTRLSFFLLLLKNAQIEIWIELLWLKMPKLRD